MTSTIEKELIDIKERLTKFVPDATIVGCHHVNVQIRIVKTIYKQLTMQFQFPSSYPDNPILIELKSKYFPPKLLTILTARCDEEAKKLLGKPQVISMVKFMNTFLIDNPLLVCSEEVTYLRKKLVREQDTLKIKQKTGEISYKIVNKRYYFELKLAVPFRYPDEAVSITLKESNFPKKTQNHFLGQSIELARQCVEPPLKKDPRAPPFKSQPSLRRVLDFVVTDCVRRFPQECCQICKERVFPNNPEECLVDENDPKFVEWVYCGHLFHNSCLDKYMKTPPFVGGKKCPGCGKRIYHEKWNITPETAEERWAHQEARKREIEDVTDFLDL